jgi:hypothetical protein
MVTLAKEGSLHARRQALGYMFDKELVHALFEQVLHLCTFHASCLFAPAPLPLVAVHKIRQQYVV